MVAIAGAADTLAGLRGRLHRHGYALRRVVVLRISLRAPNLPGLDPRRVSAIDTLVITSRNAIRALSRTPDLLVRLRRNRALAVFAVGPGTVAILRRFGFRPIGAPKTGGSAAVVERLAGGRPRRILYPRSSRAGTALARTLRHQGHTVIDTIAYRLEPARQLNPREVATLLRAQRLIVTSPSALSHLRSGLPEPGFRELRRRRGLIVLGERSARAARGHGFRGVRVAPSTSEQGFTRFLLRELRRDP